MKKPSLPLLAPFPALAILALLSLRAGGQAETTLAPPQPFSLTPPALTQLDSHAARKGAVIVKGYTKVAELDGELGSRIGISAVEIQGGSDNSVTRGLAVQVSELRDDQRFVSTSYIDEDEIDPLLNAIDTITRLDNTASRLHSFDAGYRTRGELEISSLAGASVRTIVVRSAQIQPHFGQVVFANAFFRVDRLAEIRTQLTTARRALSDADSR